MTAQQVGQSVSIAAEELAYTLVEEARLRCEYLLSDEIESPMLEWLHRDVGLAGYYACAALDTEERLHLLELARERARRGAGDGLRELVDVASAAGRAVEAAVVVGGNAEHLHLARVHLLAAEESLDALCALQS